MRSYQIGELLEENESLYKQKQKLYDKVKAYERLMRDAMNAIERPIGTRDFDWALWAKLARELLK